VQGRPGYFVGSDSLIDSDSVPDTIPAEATGTGDDRAVRAPAARTAG
jgi:hypothetical protein